VFFSTRGGSTIKIFAGSIAETVNDFLIDTRTTNVTLHEVGHSDRMHEEQNGAWLDGMPSKKWEEDDAENFVRKTRHEYMARKYEGRPRLTMRELLELKRDKFRE
jgi:hypothetical protein